MSDRLAVMYGGRIVESGPRDQLFGNPVHPYTHALLASIPSNAAADKRLLAAVVDEARTELDVTGCRFHPRCPLGDRTRCREIDPVLERVGPDHAAACHFPQTEQSLLAEATASAG
jgi:oligopeptide/dipeptide ABC transporter ATP-binding protein